MPKLKIKEWKGIYTNLDENDQRIELSRESINWRHDRGFLQIEPRYLSDYDLPDLVTEFPNHSFEWETGIYCTLTSDPFKLIPNNDKFDILALVAKAEDGGTYHRVIYLKDLTNNSPWYELSKNGNIPGIEILNHTGNTSFTDSYFSTELDGRAFFKTELGRLKVYLPHDKFWIGRLERTLWIRGNSVGNSIPLNNWHIDRIIEPYNKDNMTMTIDPQIEPIYVTNGNPYSTTGSLARTSSVLCGPKRRNGIKFDVEILEDPEDTLAARAIVHNYIGLNHDVTQWGNSNVKYECAEYELLLNAQALVNPANWPGNIPSNLKFYFPVSYPSGLYIVISKGYFNYFQPSDMSWDAKVAALGSAVAGYVTSLRVKQAGGGWVGLAGDLLYITQAAFDALSLEWIDLDKVKHVGFDKGYTDYSILATAVYDEREEVILEHIEGALDIDPATLKFAFRINSIIIPWDFNKRTTRYRFYLKMYDAEGIPELDYDMVYEFLLLDDENNFYEEFFISQSSKQITSGVPLSSNIGIAFDDKKPQTHIVISGFRDVTTDSGITLALRTEDNVNVYYSSLGGGNLQPDLIYSQNILPVYGSSVVNAIASVNKSFVALSDNTTYMFKVADGTGALVFTLDATLEFGVKSPQDVVPIQGGLAINTIHGIYSTTGYQSTLISEPIDDLVKTYFATSRIYYNRYRHELYLKPTIAEDLYRFRFKDAVWEKINKTTSVVEYQNLEAS